MPFTVDHERMSEMMVVKLPSHNPKTGQLVHGDIPTKQIPHMEYPRTIYLHPRKPFRRVREKVGEDYFEFKIYPTEAQSKVVKDKKELDIALKAGWTTDIYIPKDLPEGIEEDLVDSPETVPPVQS